ncbi:hypothetical protein ACLF3G_25490 [Falsiroseomonas sp. HC035]|uniref:hypothetical protein n=1 Tax=Falsiroseomonas sp. HC035 TaxID=3390999 RepID=UPI003D3144BD
MVKGNLGHRGCAGDGPRRAEEVLAQLKAAMDEVQRLSVELFALDAANPALAEVTATVKSVFGEDGGARWWLYPKSGLGGKNPREFAIGSPEGPDIVSSYAMQIVVGTCA